MKNKTSKILAAAGLGVLALATQSVSADPIITGGIGFNTLGAVPFTTDSSSSTSLASATQFTSFDNADIYISTGTGPYLNEYNNFTGAVTFTPFSWAGFGATAAADSIALWSFTDGGTTFSFTTTTLSASFDASSDQWTFGGDGVASITGYDDTVGSWTLQISEATSSNVTGFTWDSSAAVTSSVPDGGMTVALLGGSFFGLGMLRRKLCR